MAPSSIQMVVLEGENADGATVEEDVFDVADVDDAATATGPDQVLSAILGTREGAGDAGLELSSIGVTWTDQLEAVALRDALAAHRIDNVMLVSAFLAAAALAQNVGGAMGYERTAVLLVEPETATLAVVETSDGSIPDVYKQPIHAQSYGDAADQLGAMVAGMEKLEFLPGGLLLVGSGVDVAPLKPVLQSTTFLDVSVAAEPEMALARGAALASANAPLFASSTSALAYAQDPGTGAVDQYSLPEYLYVPMGPEPSDDELAYSAVGDDDADSPTVIIEKLFLPEESQQRRRPVLLVGSGLAVVGISAVLALEIALAIGIRTTGTVALQPTPGQHLIVPAEAPAPVQASQPLQKVSLPAPVAAPQPLSPPVAAPLPAVAPPAAPPLPAAPIVPVPVVVPPVPAPVPVHIPVPDPIESPPMFVAPPRLSIPQPVQPQPPVHLPQPPSPPQVVVPQSPPHQTFPGEGTPPKPSGPGNYGGGRLPAPGENGGPGGGHIPTPGSGGPGGSGGHVPTPGAGGPGDMGGGHIPAPGSGGPGGLGGGHVPAPGSGGPGAPGGLGGGHAPAPGSVPGGLGGGHVPTPPVGGPGGGGGGFPGLGGGHAPAPAPGGGGGLGGFGGGHAPAPGGGGGLGGFGGGHSGGGFGGGGGGFGGGHGGGGGGGGGHH